MKVIIIFKYHSRACHGRLVYDICLDEPKIKKSQFAQMKEALVEEAENVDGEQVENKAPDNINERKINTEVSSV